MVIFLEKADLNSIRQPFVERSAISKFTLKKIFKKCQHCWWCLFWVGYFPPNLNQKIRDSLSKHTPNIRTCFSLVQQNICSLENRIREETHAAFVLLFALHLQETASELRFWRKTERKNQTCSRKVWFKFSLSLWKSRFHFYVSLILGQTGVDEFAPHFPACFRSDLNQKIVVFYTRVGGKCEVKKKKNSGRWMKSEMRR